MVRLLMDILYTVRIRVYYTTFEYELTEYELTEYVLSEYVLTEFYCNKNIRILIYI